MHRLIVSFLLCFSSLHGENIKTYADYLDNLPKAAYFVAGAVTATTIQQSIRYINNNPGTQANLLAALYGISVCGLPAFIAYTVLHATGSPVYASLASTVPILCIYYFPVKYYAVTNSEDDLGLLSFIIQRAQIDTPSAELLELRINKVKSYFIKGFIGGAISYVTVGGYMLYTLMYCDTPLPPRAA